ncbi:MAG TPA: hypothetical protein VMU77_04420, partial [Acidimicrobiales bacterium]|nr:hypothetical protein [Acidimicrobiales bacterium]
MDPVSELEDVIRTLAAIENRGSATPGERTAAYWLSDRFAEHGCESCVEEVPAHGTYWWPMGIGTGMGLLAGIASLAGRRWIALLGGLA